MPADPRLTALLSRAPWRTTDGPLTAERLADVYARIVAGRLIPDRSGRITDRALQLLRKTGIARFAGGKWEVVDVVES